MTQWGRFWLLVAIVAFGGGAIARADLADSSQEAGAAAKGHDEHEHVGLAGGVNKDPAEVRTDLAIWSFVVFLILLALLWKFAWSPIASALEAREKHIHSEIAQAEQANAEAKRLSAEHEKKMAEVQNEVRAIIDEARRDAQHTQQEIMKQAQTEAQATRDRAVREIEQARDQALQELFHRAADAATEMASQIVQRSLNPQDHRDLVAKAMKELPSRN
jgi:F-type H+-transporting ATPase subunit b